MATVPTPATIVAASSPTAVNLNTFRDGVNWAQTNKPLAQLRQAATQNLTTSTWEPISFAAGSEDLDRDGGHSTTAGLTTKYIALTAGWYRFSGGVEFAGNGTGFRGACFAKNGTFPGTPANGRGYATAFPGGSTTQAGVGVAGVLFSLNGTTDYVELFGIQSSGGTIATSLTLGGSWMAVEWVGTA